MGATSVTHLASSIPTIWRRAMVKTAEGQLTASKFADSEVIGKGEGGTYKLNRVLRVADVTSTSTAGTRVAGSSANNLLTNSVSVTPQLLQNSFGFKEDADIKSILSKQSARDAVALNMGRSLNRFALKILATQGMRERVDASATYTKSGTATGGSTTTVVDTGLTVTGFSGSYVSVVNPEGANYDAPAKKVTNVGTANTLSFSADAFDQTIDTTSKYRVVAATAIDSTSTYRISTSALWRIQCLHALMETEKFEGGGLYMFVHPNVYLDLWSDNDFKNSALYDDNERLKGFNARRWAGITMIEETQVYRQDADGTENASGAVFVLPCIGKHSYMLLPWGYGKGKFGADFIPVETPDSENLTMAERYLSWKAYFGGIVGRSTGVVNLLCGASSMNITL